LSSAVTVGLSVFVLADHVRRDQELLVLVAADEFWKAVSSPLRARLTASTR